jgi:hypothetical protein
MEPVGGLSTDVKIAGRWGVVSGQNTNTTLNGPEPTPPASLMSFSALQRARDSLNKHGRGAPNGTALRRIVGGAVMERFRQPATGADCVSGESARSGSHHQRGANDGAAGDCSVGNSSAASACCRSIQTPAGRVKVLATASSRLRLLRDAGRRVSFPFAIVSDDSTTRLLPRSSSDR